jgi:5-amino-6-(5-phosphoribosylamino)uracil reductase
VPDRPHTIVSCAISLDGYLDDASPSRLILSGPEDLDEVDQLRAEADAILVGAGTIRADNPRLLIRDKARIAARQAAGKSPHPFRVTLTSSGDLDPHANFFTGPGTALVYCPTTAAAKITKNLDNKGPVLNGPAVKGTDSKVAVIDAGADLTLSAVLADLFHERCVVTLLAEGGAGILRDLLAANLADELRLAIAPFLVGDSAAPRFALPASYPQGPANPMRLIALRQLGDVAVLRYSISGNNFLHENK